METERDKESDPQDVSHYVDTIDRLRKSYKEGVCRSLEFRVSALNSLIRFLTENEGVICDALHKDLHKCKFEALVTEILFTKNEVIYALNNLKDWMQPKAVDKPFVMKFDECFIQPQSLGLVLIIGAWNYPIQLLLTPLIGAVSAGNCAIIKPSEVSAHTSELLVRLLPKYLDKDCFAVIAGGPTETTHLLTFKFDKIFFTGSAAVGRAVLKAAANHLTPVTLELGGRNPCYVGEDCDLDTVARSLAWGRFLNAGQTCVAPDYVLCSPSTCRGLVPALGRALQQFFGPDPRLSPDYGRIVSLGHFLRIQRLLQAGRVALGGQSSEQELYIAPTVLVDVEGEGEEVFGPVLSVLTVGSVGQAVHIINSSTPPLAIYLFTKDTQVVGEFLRSTTSGSLCVNDTVIQTALQSLPFGGIGESGMGAYHGKFSFDTFSHSRACVLKHDKPESVDSVRFPPYSPGKLTILQWATDVKRKDGRCHLL